MEQYIGNAVIGTTVDLTVTNENGQKIMCQSKVAYIDSMDQYSIYAEPIIETHADGETFYVTIKPTYQTTAGINIDGAYYTFILQNADLVQKNNTYYLHLKCLWTSKETNRRTNDRIPYEAQGTLCQGESVISASITDISPTGIALECNSGHEFLFKEPIDVSFTDPSTGEQFQIPSSLIRQSRQPDYQNHISYALRFNSDQPNIRSLIDYTKRRNDTQDSRKRRLPGNRRR